MTKLRKLFISHNKMMTIPSDTFQYISGLQYLDLSFTNVLDFNYNLPLPTIEAVINLIYGVKIQKLTFKFLPNLLYLDLGHTKITRSSAVAFAHLSEKLKYLSLCYTSFPMVGSAIFKNTALVGIDLSGNPYASYNIIDDAFDGVADTLKYLFFESSNIKDLNWLKGLRQLNVLGLSGNNLNTITTDVFNTLKNLKFLDLSANYIGNWYTRAFTDNLKLRVLNLRGNNINILTSEMLKDFQLLDYLSLGDNNFVCDCLLRELVDISAANNKEAECARNLIEDAQDFIIKNSSFINKYISSNLTLGMRSVMGRTNFATNYTLNANDFIDFSHYITKRYFTSLNRSFHNIKQYEIAKKQQKFRVIPHFFRVLRSDTSAQCSGSEPVYIYDKLNGTTLKFQLLDYEDTDYYCFNETQRMNFGELNCVSQVFEDLTDRLQTLMKTIIVCVSTLLGLSLLGIVIYYKRWHIYYYYSSLKSAALVSEVTKDNIDKLNALAINDPNLVYDIFISYCQNDRQWILEELLPNVEEVGDLSICMHERDFEVGMTILDNIISCMDRSRAMMLIISSNFLLSHWCQFEMYLAQHRIFEVNKEHLILVFLEDIPRNKRPKNLQYLMEVKTYIKWPSLSECKQSDSEECKMFWKRLKKSLQRIVSTPR
ncbi:toll-like receptor 4 [Teleopsis dalmanni]|nr:toll-like receptor 4 [Teleopsis dalmanni]